MSRQSGLPYSDPVVHILISTASVFLMINGRIIGTELREVPPERVSYLLKLALQG